MWLPTLLPLWALYGPHTFQLSLLPYWQSKLPPFAPLAGLLLQRHLPQQAPSQLLTGAAWMQRRFSDRVLEVVLAAAQDQVRKLQSSDIGVSCVCCCCQDVCSHKLPSHLAVLEPLAATSGTEEAPLTFCSQLCM